MSPRMCLAGPKTPFTVNRGQHLSAAEKFALLDPHTMHNQALYGSLHIDDLQLHAVADDPAGIGVLPARLGIKRRLLQDNLDELALLGGLSEHPVNDDPSNLRLLA